MNLPPTFGGQPLVVLAADDAGRGSPIGLFVVLVLCIAVYFLWKSMNRHLKRVPPSFDPPTSEGIARPEASETGDQAEASGRPTPPREPQD
jgi:hypothetical protein